MPDDRRKNHAPPSRRRLTFPPAHNFYIVAIPTADTSPGSGSAPAPAPAPAMTSRGDLRPPLYVNAYAYAYACATSTPGEASGYIFACFKCYAAAPLTLTYTRTGINFSRRAPSSHRARRCGKRASTSPERGGRRPARQPQDGKNRAALLPLSSRPPSAPSLAARMRTLRARPWALR